MLVALPSGLNASNTVASFNAATLAVSSTVNISTRVPSNTEFSV